MARPESSANARRSKSGLFLADSRPRKRTSFSSAEIPRPFRNVPRAGHDRGFPPRHPASARLPAPPGAETPARLAIGAVAKLLLKTIEVEVLSHVIAVGRASFDGAPEWSQVQALARKEDVLLGCVDPDVEQKMKAEVDQALRTGDSVGGIFEVIGHHVPPGLGTYANWDDRLDAQLAAAVMSLQAVKAVEIGRGVHAAISFGSQVHDAIGYSEKKNAKNGDEPFTRFTRAQNNAGGIEGGISNGEDILVRGYLKPISTLRRPLGSVDFATREPVKAAYERSDVCVVPAAGVAAEAMVALTFARCALEKFGGDSVTELERNYRSYCKQIAEY